MVAGAMAGEKAMAENNATVSIAKWYNDYPAAVSLRFDDGMESHVLYVIPRLNRAGISGTFMINPERNALINDYKKNKDFWQKDFPKTIHKLGNHTMNHKGAKNLEEAEYEIGEASKYIWSLFPDDSKLLVFASGGGEKWGGKRWSRADESYKKLVDKYHLIDLYDGKHPAIGVEGKDAGSLCRTVENAIESGEHKAFTFHQVGTPRWVDRIKGWLKDQDLSFPEKEFEGFVQCLQKNRYSLWTPPLVQILKYETERKAARVSVKEEGQSNLRLQLEVSTDPKLYDQPLTVKVEGSRIRPGMKAVQEGRECEVKVVEGSIALIHVRPVSGIIEVTY